MWLETVCFDATILGVSDPENDRISMVGTHCVGDEGTNANQWLMGQIWLASASG